jgi:hypothetical protein
MATNREEPTLDFWQDELSKDFFASIYTRFGGCVTNWRSNQGFPKSQDLENNRVNSGNILSNIRTILSRAWKETSLKVQRLMDEAKSIFDMPVILTRVPCST